MMTLHQQIFKKIFLISFLVFPVSAFAVTWVPIYNGGITIFIPVEQAAGTAVLREFEYDALGRLVKVEKNGSEVSDYSYDLAGNRTKVVENGVGASASEGGIVSSTPSSSSSSSSGSSSSSSGSGGSAPGIPTGLSYSMTPGNTYDMDWSNVAGATYYNLKIYDAEIIVVLESEHSNPTSQLPHWVQACNTNGCSNKAYF